MASPLLSEVRFGSYLVYSPKGTSDVSRRSQRLRDAIKRGDEPTRKNIVAHLAKHFAAAHLEGVLGPDVTLVPCPRSSVLVSGALWPSRLIAEELVAAGLGREVLLCLERVTAVPKSAFQAPGNRTTALRHYETISAAADLTAAPRLTIVDDFVTRGRTLLGAATRLADVCPQASVRAFALVRTMGLQADVAELVSPCVGTIQLRGDDAWREP